MFKELIVDRVFDGVAASSAALENLAWFLAGEDQDRIAMLVVAACCMLVAVCHQMLARGGRVWQCARWFVIPTASLLAGQALLLHLGTSRSFLNAERIEKKQGSAFRYQIKKDMMEKVTGWERWLCRAPRLLSLERMFFSSRDMREAKSIQHVAERGGGLFRIRDGGLWFSAPDSKDPREGSARYYLVCDRPWRKWLSASLGAAYVIFGLGLFCWRFAPGAWQFTAQLLSDWRFASLAGVFLLYFGAHQMRFLHQDHRMQMVTSRDDDGYMMGRLVKAAELKTMDPNPVGNVAYASIGYYPFAALPAAAGHLGVSLPVEALNLHVRGQKILASLGMLAAVWLLALRQFGGWAAGFAVLMLMTSQGFLQYSSYPFYPDVLMAAASTAAIGSMLSLAGGWSDRSFFLAVCFAAFSVSIKFITFLLFPFLGFVAAYAIWREHGGRWQPAIKFAASRALLALPLCLAVYFISNPYLRYNYETMVPSWKDFYDYYAVETPVLVAGAAATVSTWITACYSFGSDHAEVILLCFAALAAILAVWQMAGGRGILPSGQPRSLLIIIAFFAAFQLYLFRAVTLPVSIDARLVLPILPFVYIAAAVGLVAIWSFFQNSPFFRRWGLAGPWGARLSWMSLAVLGAWLLLPRAGNLKDFFSSFGRVPDESQVADFLGEIQAMLDHGILTSLQSYIPAKYPQVTDGEWETHMIVARMFREGRLPAVFIEDEAYYQNYFSEAVGSRGFQTARQQKLHSEGHAFLTRLREGAVSPYAYVSSGREVIRTNDLPWTWVDFHAYASQLAFRENLLLRCGKTAVPGETKLFEWPGPTTLSWLHVSTRGEAVSSRMKARVRLENGLTEDIPFQGGFSGLESSTQHFIRFDPPRDMVACEILEAGLAETKAKVSEVAAAGPFPISPNPVGSCFDLTATEPSSDGGQSKWQRLAAVRPGEASETVLAAGGRLGFRLSSATGRLASRLFVVFEGKNAGPLLAECRCLFASGEWKTIMPKAERSLNPDHFAFVFDIPPGSPLTGCEIGIHNPSASPFAAKLLQVAAQLAPVITR